MEVLLFEPRLSACFGFVVGACLGSFLNLCAHRIPQGTSIVRPSSRCLHCLRPISPYLNLPILGWLWLRGRSRCCNRSIPVRYLIVEVALAGFFAWFLMDFHKHQDLGVLASRAVFTWLLVAVIVIDAETMLIPDRLSIGGALIGILLCFAFPTIQGVHSHHPIGLESWRAAAQSLIGAVVGSGVLYWIGALAERAFGREALGEGDVKLLGCIGAFCGWQGALFAIFGGAVLGCLFLMGVFLVARIFGAESRLAWGAEVPFGPYLALGALAHFLFLRTAVDAWFAPLVSVIL